MLNLYGVEVKLLEAVRCLSWDDRANVRKLAKKVKVLRPLVRMRHGWVMSPWLFSIYCTVYGWCTERDDSENTWGEKSIGTGW